MTAKGDDAMSTAGIPPIAARLADYLRSQAAWRDVKAQEYPDDHRNARSAELLDAAARDIETKPDDDPRLLKLSLLQEPYGLDVFSPREDAARLISRFGFDRHPAEVDELLDAVIEADVASEPESLEDEIRWGML